VKISRRYSAPIAFPVLVLFGVGISCSQSIPTEETRRSALVGDPIESVGKVQGAAPAPIDLTFTAPESQTIDSASFTIGLFDEDEPTLCPGFSNAFCLKSGVPGNGVLFPLGCPCGILTDLDPQHRGWPNNTPYPAFDDVSVVEVVVNVGAAKAMHWDWDFKTYMQRPFNEFWVEAIDQNGLTTTVLEKTGAPTPWGFQPNKGGAMGSYLIMDQHVDLDLTPWAEQTIKLRFVVHHNYDPGWFTVGSSSPLIPPSFTGAFDMGASKLYVRNVRVDTCAVTSLEFLAIASAVDDNPDWLGGGKRIFADAPSVAGGGPDGSLVGVRGTTSMPNCPVRIRSIDVDDPAFDTTIDRNGPAGGDNINKSCGSFASHGGGCQIDPGSGGDGRFSVGFNVTKHPGDNFVIIAGTDPAKVAKATIAFRDGKPVVQDAAGNDVPAGSIVATPMLSVWRRLHLQVHSMGVVTGNHAAGTITSIGPSSSTASGLAAMGVTTRTPLRFGRFANGRLVVGAMSFPIAFNSESVILVEDPAGALTRDFQGASFVAYDDDNVSFSGLLNGDEGFDIPGPDLRIVADSDLPSENVLAPAYIRPIYDLAGDGALPFQLNVNDIEDVFSDSMTSMTADYWGIPLIGAYQYQESACLDPDGDLSRLGESMDGLGAVMYLETIRDGGGSVVDDGPTTTAHELGHMLGAKHGQGGLMGTTDKTGKTSITETVFSSKSIYSIRHRRLAP